MHVVAVTTIYKMCYPCADVSRRAMTIDEHLKRMKKNLEKEGRTEKAKELDFFPQTYHMPSEASLFIRKFKELRQNGVNQIWIMKPIGRAQGKGIFLVNKLSQIESWLKERAGARDMPQARDTEYPP